MLLRHLNGALSRGNYDQLGAFKPGLGLGLARKLGRSEDLLVRQFFHEAAPNCPLGRPTRDRQIALDSRLSHDRTSGALSPPSLSPKPPQNIAIASSRVSAVPFGTPGVGRHDRRD